MAPYQIVLSERKNGVRDGAKLPQCNLLQVQDGQLSERDLRWLLDLFQLIDNKQDDYLDAEEIWTAFCHVGVDVDRVYIASWLQAQASKRRQGKISRKEFIGSMFKHAKYSIVQQLWPPFDALYSPKGLSRLRTANGLKARKTEIARLCLPDVSLKIRTKSSVRDKLEGRQGFLHQPVPHSIIAEHIHQSGFNLGKKHVPLEDNTTQLPTCLPLRRHKLLSGLQQPKPVLTRSKNCVYQSADVLEQESSVRVSYRSAPQGQR
mmetsp:Transcript_13182/g.31214  ORF Transcript_13182/g.31214 Transcript_13182/m.31214 type:complete len:262 (-) Transcript_13182:233-1018(-)